jgi:hypothetical protein
MYNCPSCHTPFELGIKFCQHCGYDLANNFLSEPICPTCKKEFPSGTKFCDNDGSSLVTKDKLIPKCVKCGKEYTDSIKFCPDDGGTITAEAYRSQMPLESKPGYGTPTNKNSQPPFSNSNISDLEKTINLQFTWFTWLLWGGLATAIIGVGFLAIFAAFIIGWTLQYRAWAVIQTINPRTTPSNAIGFQLIPFFNFYWYFIAYYGLSQDMNKFIEINQLSIPKFDERIGLATSIVYCSPVILILIAFVMGAIGEALSISLDNDSISRFLDAIFALLFIASYISMVIMSSIFTKELRNVLIGIIRNI